MLKMKKSNIRSWEDIEKEIRGFLTFNPEGTLKDLFEMHGTSFKLKYYKHRPKDYLFPNQTERKPRPSKPSSSKKQYNYAQKKHVKAFREACKCDLKTLYMIMEQNDFDRSSAPDDWRQNKQIYIELMQEAVNNYLNPPEEKIEEEKVMPKKETPLPLPSSMTRKPRKSTPTSPAQDADMVKIAKIDAYMEIARMIKDIE